MSGDNIGLSLEETSNRFILYCFASLVSHHLLRAPPNTGRTLCLLFSAALQHRIKIVTHLAFANVNIVHTYLLCPAPHLFSTLDDIFLSSNFCSEHTAVLGETIFRLYILYPSQN